MTLIHHAIFAHGSYALLDVRMITVALLQGLEQRLQMSGIAVAIKHEAFAGEREKVRR